MTKQRLSKLQKWILTKCYKTLDRVKGWTNGFLYRTEIVYGYFGIINNKAEASTSRAIRKLINKGLITGFTPRRFRHNINDPEMLMHKKMDYATIIAMSMKKKGKTIADYNETLKKVGKIYKPNEKLIVPAIFRKETIKVITLTEIGKEAGRCLLLSCEKRLKVNNKEI